MSDQQQPGGATPPEQERELPRRDFLRAAALGAAGLAVSSIPGVSRAASLPAAS